VAEPWCGSFVALYAIAVATRRRRMSLKAVHRRKNPNAAAGNTTQGPQATQVARAGLPLLLQRQSVMGKPGDAFEREAESAGETVQSRGVAAGAGPNNVSPRGGNIPLFLQPRRAAGGLAGRPGVASAGGHPALGPGQPLDGGSGGFMEAQFGAGLSAVRVHTDSSAARLADMLGAKAFTAGRDIVFGEHQFQPDTAEGRGLLAHELTHAVQRGYPDSQAPMLQLAPMDAPPLTPAVAPVPSGVPALPPAPPIPVPFMTPPAPVPQSAAGSQPELANGAATAQLPQSSAGESAEAPKPGQGEAVPGQEGHGPAAAAGKGKKGTALAGAAAGGKGGARAAAGRGAAEGATETSGGGGADFSPGPAQATGGSGVAALGTGELVLIDVELAEHERWAGAMGRVGEVASLQRAEFIAESVGSGFISGAASGLATGLGIGLISRAVPALGPIIGGGMALHGLATRD
jgi:Domain of unknown function (DUF4157)